VNALFIHAICPHQGLGILLLAMLRHELRKVRQRDAKRQMGAVTVALRSSSSTKFATFS
jgi:hypothetical protein